MHQASCLTSTTALTARAGGSDFGHKKSATSAALLEIVIFKFTGITSRLASVECKIIRETEQR